MHWAFKTRSLKILLIVVILFFVLFNFLLFNKSNKSGIDFVNDSKNYKITYNYILTKSDDDSRVHIAYVHFIDTQDKMTIENFKVFMDFAYTPCNPNAQFTFIFNHERPTEKDFNIYDTLYSVLGEEHTLNLLKCSLTSSFSNETNPNANTRVIFRLNKNGGDLCAHIEFLGSKEWDEIEKKFSFFFIINSSVRGPFLPNYWLRPWWYMAIDVFKYYPKTAAVGPYFSCEKNKHIQSFFIALNKNGLRLIKEVWRCPNTREKRFDWIVQTETVSKEGSIFL